MAESEGETKFNKQFLSALNSNSVSSKLGEIIKSALVSFEKSLQDDLNKRFNEMALTISTLRTELKDRDGTIEQLKEASDKIKSENVALKQRLLSVETEIRRDNVIFTGLKLSYADAANSSTGTNESSLRLVNEVAAICSNTLQVPTTALDISSAFPLFKGSRTAPSVVLVKFNRRSHRDNVFFARKKLMTLSATENKVFVNEDLPPETRKLMGSIRRMVGNGNVAGVWSRSGKVFVKRADNSVIPVAKLSDLNV